MVWYVDTSAAVKLVVHEPDTAALGNWIASTSDTLVSCDLIRTELLRAAGRAAPAAVVLARNVLDALALSTVTTATFERAAQLAPAEMRSLDAIHLAAALEFGDELSGLVTYDARLAAAAMRHGITVVAPTADAGETPPR